MMTKALPFDEDHELPVEVSETGMGAIDTLTGYWAETDQGALHTAI